MKYYFVNLTGKSGYISKDTADKITTNDYANIIWYEGKTLTVIADESESGKYIVELVKALTGSHNTNLIKKNIRKCAGEYAV